MVYEQSLRDSLRERDYGANRRRRILTYLMDYDVFVNGSWCLLNTQKDPDVKKLLKKKYIEQYRSVSFTVYHTYIRLTAKGFEALACQLK